MHDEVIKAIKKYFEDEVKEAIDLKEYCARFDEDYARAKNTILDRGLGASFFAQKLGIKYEEIDKLYHDFKEKVDKV